MLDNRRDRTPERANSVRVAWCESPHCGAIHLQLFDGNEKMYAEVILPDHTVDRLVEVRDILRRGEFPEPKP